MKTLCFAAFSVFLAWTRVLGDSVRVDVSGAESGVRLVPLDASPGATLSNGTWKPTPAEQQQIVFCQLPLLPGEWRDLTFRFRPEQDGEVRLALKGEFSKQGEVWVCVDAVQAEGAAVVNGDFEELDAQGGPVGWEVRKGDAPEWPDAPGESFSGLRCAKVSHGNAISQTLAVKAGQEVGISLRARALAAPFAPDAIDLSAAANRGFADPIAGDGLGGWTDQGPSSDLHGLPTGDRVFHGARMRIIDPETNDGKGCLVLATGALLAEKEFLKNLPSSADVACRTPPRRYLYLLHASGWTPDDAAVLGRLRLTYADGTDATLDVTANVDVGNWWKPRNLRNGAVAWETTLRNAPVGLYLSRFDLEPKPVTALRFEAVTGMWMVVAAGVGDDAIAMPHVKEATFDFSLAAMQRDYPELNLLPVIVEAMRAVPALAPPATPWEGRPAAYPHGEWCFLPIPPKAMRIDAAAIAATLVPVPGMIGFDRAYNKPTAQPEEWKQVSRMWYSTNLRVPPELAGGPLAIAFDSVDFATAVFVNGRPVGAHAGRYTPFAFTLPADLDLSQPVNLSLFVVKITEGFADGKCPFQQGSVKMEAGTYGGIVAPLRVYRDTPVAMHHVRVSTSVRDRKLGIELQTAAQPAGVSVKPIVLDADGQAVGDLAFDAQPAAPRMAWKLPWRSPLLWSHETPYLYTLRLIVTGGGADTHHDVSFGFRNVEVRGDRLLLNGIPVRLFGTSYGNQGTSGFLRSDEEAHYRIFKAYKEQLGFNSLRIHHTPAPPAVLRAADRAGLLVINQSGLWTAGRWANYRAGDLFQANIAREFEEWLWAGMNSPSTILWDVENEYLRGSPEWLDFFMKLDDIVRIHDTSRPIEHSGAAFQGGRASICHVHQHENYDEIFGIMPEVGKPFIFGEYWVGRGMEKRVMTLPRDTFADDAYNAVYLRCLEDKTTLIRAHGATGLFPFKLFEAAFSPGMVRVPARQKFEPESINPGDLIKHLDVNPYRPAVRQVDPAFGTMARRVFAPVAGFLRERSLHVTAGRKAHRTLYLANDSLTDRALRTQVVLQVGGTEQSLLDATGPLPAGHDTTQALDFTPATPGAGALTIRLSWDGGGYTNMVPATVWTLPPQDGPEVSVLGTDATLALVGAAGLRTKRLATLADARDGDTVLVGEDVLDTAARSGVVAALGRDGARVIVLAQRATDLADVLGMRMRRTARRRQEAIAGFFADPVSHTEEAGRYAAAHARELLTAGLADYDYPGGLGIAYADAYAIPSPSFITPPTVTPLFGGTRPEDVPVLLYQGPGSRAVACELRLEAHASDDPRAAHLLRELVSIVRRPAQERKSGAVFATDKRLRARLGRYGFGNADSAEEAALVVADLATYQADAALRALPRVLVTDTGLRGELDGRAFRGSRIETFNAMLVAADVPGLYDLTAGHFDVITAGGKMGGAQRPVVTGIALDNSREAVAGKIQGERFELFDRMKRKALVAYYEEAGRQRWATGLGQDSTWVMAMVVSMAAELGIPYAWDRVTGDAVCQVAAAGEVALDGLLNEWLYEDDTNVHNWARAHPQPIGAGDRWGLLYLMVDDASLHLALVAPEAALAPDSQHFLRVRLGADTLTLSRATDGTATVAKDGAPLFRAVWRALDGPFADAGVRQERLFPAFALEATLPRTALALAPEMGSEAMFGTGTETLPATPFACRLP